MLGPPTFEAVALDSHRPEGDAVRADWLPNCTATTPSSPPSGGSPPRAAPTESSGVAWGEREELS